MAFLTQNKAKLCKILIITLVFEKSANFENCDHNIDPRFLTKNGISFFTPATAYFVGIKVLLCANF
jgi:hypothetical protein